MFLVICAVLSLAACTPTGLPAGLTARMDAPGAQLDQAEALNIINQYRASRGATPLTLDANLNIVAQTLANKYATSNTPPKQPDAAAAIRVSAGYTTFAETFSGWRSREADASALNARNHKRMGLGVAYSANSTYGTHWVILFDEGPALVAN